MVKIEKSNFYPISLVLVSTIFTSAGQLLLKIGADKLQLDLSMLTNYPLIVGILAYAIAATILIISLKNGELSLLYPIYATSYIWVMLLSKFVLNEPTNTLKWSGVAVIIVGVSLIGFGGKK